MKRRDFLKSGLGSLASATALEKAHGGAKFAGQGVNNRKIRLENKYLEWIIDLTEESVQSTGLRNKLSGQYYELKNSVEYLLTLSQAMARIEIQWWNFELGSDNDNSPPDQEKGFKAGYQLPGFNDESWEKTLNPLLRAGFAWLRPVVFNGYGWFRQRFKLPAAGVGQPVYLCLGGYNQEDWLHYWVYINGREVGRWSRFGRWRTPEILRLDPGDDLYRTLKFGQGSENLLAMRTYQYDKHFGGLSDEALDRFVFDARLYDQFISVGPPYLHVADFKLRDFRQERAGDSPAYLFNLTHNTLGLDLALHYELEGFIRRKWFEVTNLGRQERLLLDVSVDDFGIEASSTEGDYGQPVILADEIFCALEHPAGLNQGLDGRVKLLHFPGVRLPAGKSIQSKTSIVGVAPKNHGREQFLKYIGSRSVRERKFQSIYDPLFIHNSPDDLCWTLSDTEMLHTLDTLEGLQKHGVSFDYYVADWGWADPYSDLKQFLPHCFPEGPGQVAQRVQRLGMKWGLWFSGGAAGLSIGDNPETIPSRSAVPGGKWPVEKFRDGFSQGGGGELCLASEPFFSMLRDAIIYHHRNFGLKFYKLDAATYYCNSTDHPHLPGKYSSEANYDAVIRLARETREAIPGLFIMWYWGIRSPFFALEGNTIAESRLALETDTPSDHPALYFMDSAILMLDQGTQLAEYIPPLNKDSLGLVLSPIPEMNYVRKQRWREQILMDLGRGNMLFPQIWGDLTLLNDADIAFLAKWQKLAKDNQAIFLNRKLILGDVWKNEPYGYAFFQNTHGFLFMNNMSFSSRKISLRLSETIGLTGRSDSEVMLLSRFPEERQLSCHGKSTFRTGDTLETWLRPFEVAVWEVFPNTVTSNPFPQRELPFDRPHIDSHRLELEPEPAGPDANLPFGDPDPTVRSFVPRPTLKELAQRGYQKKIAVRRGKIPALTETAHILAIVVRLQQNGRLWRQVQPADLIQIMGKIGGRRVAFEAVPAARQTGEFVWVPWLVFKTRIGLSWSGMNLWVAINGYLPPDVDWLIEGWIVPRWWE